jgi:hypothetical protein
MKTRKIKKQYGGVFFKTNTLKNLNKELRNRRLERNHTRYLNEQRNRERTVKQQNNIRFAENAAQKRRNWIKQVSEEREEREKRKALAETLRLSELVGMELPPENEVANVIKAISDDGLQELIFKILNNFGIDTTGSTDNTDLLSISEKLIIKIEKDRVSSPRGLTFANFSAFYEAQVILNTLQLLGYNIDDLQRRLNVHKEIYIYVYDINDNIQLLPKTIIMKNGRSGNGKELSRNAFERSIFGPNNTSYDVNSGRYDTLQWVKDQYNSPYSFITKYDIPQLISTRPRWR